MTFVATLALLVVLAVSTAWAQSQGPHSVDGNVDSDGCPFCEWDLVADFKADMIRAYGQGGQTDVLTKLYIEYVERSEAAAG